MQRLTEEQTIKSDLVFVLAILSCALLGAVTLCMILQYRNLDEGMVRIDINENNARQMATNMFLSRLESIGKISIALIGALWALAVYQDSHIDVQTKPQKVVFLSANLYFLGSFVAYILGSDFLIARIFYHSAIDLDAPIVQFWRNTQMTYFVLGLFWLVVTIVACFQRQGDDKSKGGNK